VFLISIPVRAEVGAPEAGIKNVLFIILDALRADHLGVYGYPRNTTPNIDAIARQGIVFDQAIVQAGWTKPSMASYMTSTTPGIHNVLRQDDKLPEDLITMAEIFRDNGYYTFGFINNPHLGVDMGFDRGFNIYEYMSDKRIFDAVAQVFAGRYHNIESLDVETLNEFLTEYNLLDNHGFEEGINDWNGRGDWFIASEANSGRSAAHIDKKETTPRNFSQLNQRIKLEYGKKYIFGAFIKTSNLRDAVRVELKEEGGDSRRYLSTRGLKGDNEWTLLWRPFTPEKSNQITNKTDIEIRAGRINEYSQGEFWVDDVFILPEEDLPLFRPSERIFTYIHLLDPHAPYKPPEAYLSCISGKDRVTLIDKYDAEIKSMDNKLGILFEALKISGVLDETLLIIASDHGEAFGEHGRWKHGAKCIYGEVARVPLIFYNPGLFPRPDRVRAPFQAIDLLPSLVDLLHLKLPPGEVLQGRSYFPVRRRASAPAYLYECPHLFSEGSGGAYVRTVSDGKWKYISNEYYSSVDGMDIRGRFLDEQGTEIKVISPTGEEVLICGSEAELVASNFYTRFKPDLREEILRIFQDSKDKSPELYQIENDPGEKINLIGAYPGEAKRLKRAIDGQVDADRTHKNVSGEIIIKKSEITEELRKKFQALGYMN
jgi:arylsulfatase A-like enzyme